MFKFRFIGRLGRLPMRAWCIATRYCPVPARYRSCGTNSDLSNSLNYIPHPKAPLAGELSAVLTEGFREPKVVAIRGLPQTPPALRATSPTGEALDRAVIQQADKPEFIAPYPPICTAPCPVRSRGSTADCRAGRSAPGNSWASPGNPTRRNPGWPAAPLPAPLP